MASASQDLQGPKQWSLVCLRGIMYCFGCQNKTNQKTSFDGNKKAIFYLELTNQITIINCLTVVNLHYKICNENSMFTLHYYNNGTYLTQVCHLVVPLKLSQTRIAPENITMMCYQILWGTWAICAAFWVTHSTWLPNTSVHRNKTTNQLQF